MSDNDVRQILDELIRNSSDDYASVSRMLGRNPTYIQQFVKRGVPKRLQEDDRRALSRHFGVAEAVLGGPAEETTSLSISAQSVDQLHEGEYLLVPALDVAASAGRGTRVSRDFDSAELAFKTSWVRQFATGSIEALSILHIEGDSMQPTLNSGDQILLDTNDKLDRMRDGIYALRIDGGLLVKRLAINPSTRKLSIRSDNPAYPSWDDCDLDTVAVVGRVVWVGRSLG